MKKTIWLCKNLDDQLLDDAAQKVAEVDKASSKLLMEVEQYKMLNVKDHPNQSR